MLGSPEFKAELKVGPILSRAEEDKSLLSAAMLLEMQPRQGWLAGLPARVAHVKLPIQ